MVLSSIENRATSIELCSFTAAGKYTQSDKICKTLFNSHQITRATSSKSALLYSVKMHIPWPEAVLENAVVYIDYSVLADDFYGIYALGML